MTARVVTDARAAAIIHNLARCAPLEGPFLLPANICPIVPMAVLKAGRTVEFHDIDPDDLCLDAALTLARCRDGSRPVAGVIFARTYGYMGARADALFAALKRIDPAILLIDDRCAAVPDTRPPPAGAADAIVYSTGRGKCVDLDGGGFAWLRPGVAYKASAPPYRPAALRRIEAAEKIHKADGTPMFTAGSAGRLLAEDWLEAVPAAPGAWDALRARIAAAAPGIAAHKTRMNALYQARLPASVRLPVGFHDWRFQIRVPGKRRLLRSIFAAGHFAGDHYHPASRLFGHPPAPQADRLYDSVVNLFNDHNVDADQVKAIAAIVAGHLDAA